MTGYITQNVDGSWTYITKYGNRFPIIEESKSPLGPKYGFTVRQVLSDIMKDDWDDWDDF